LPLTPVPLKVPANGEPTNEILLASTQTAEYVPAFIELGETEVIEVDAVFEQPFPSV
jgi:hypothetical protein